MASMVKTLELAMSRAAELPEAAQEELGQVLLKHLDEWAALRAEIDVGLAELDAGLGKPLDIEALLRALNENHAKRG
jgi:hypothetical protein